MYVASLDVDLGAGGVEVLVLQLANLATVHGICVAGTKFLHVELHHAATDFLVGGESDLDFAVLELRVFHDVLCGIHDLGHARLVVGTQ